MSLLFINNSAETFTPTQSGALATIIYECCRVAQRQSQRPVVITRRCAAAPFGWDPTLFLDYPQVPSDKLGVLFCRTERKLTGWRNLRQREYARRVTKSIRRAGLQKMPMVLFNDPETAVVLRREFPQAFIAHWFQNQQECKAKFRRQFRGAASVVLGVSDFTSRWIERYYDLPAGSVQTVHNGVDTEQFRPAGSAVEGVPIVNFVGRTGIEKGPDVLLKAALQVAGKTNRFAVQMIGSNHWDRFELDDYQRQLSELAGELEHRGVRVRRPGHVGRAALPAELRSAHIHVVPARWDEPFGMTTIEGMASGLATIASRTGGTPEVVGDHAMLFERESVPELAACLETLICDAGLRQKYARRARERAETFTWENVWSKLASVFR